MFGLLFTRATSIGGALTAVAVSVVVLAGPAVADGCTPQNRPPAGSGTPLQNRLYDGSQLAGFATGRGIRIAVVDSGVDASVPQLSGRGAVEQGRDFLRGTDNGRQDCVGHGTEVASIIAARPVAGSPLHGLAPDATIVPVRVTESHEDTDGNLTGESGSPAELARAIRWAADPRGGNAQVINMSLSSPHPSDDVRRAVADALAHNVVIVAAVGNAGSKKNGNPTPFPAAYPGVIGVAAVDGDGMHEDYSGHGPFVDLAAPGDNLTVVVPGGGLSLDSGTSFASPLVAATAALILQRFPDSSPQDVARRLLATTDPAPDIAGSPVYGAGLLDPYRALTDTVNPDAPTISSVPERIPPIDPALIAAQQRRSHSRDAALLYGSAALLALLLFALGVAVVRRGQQRGWSAGQP